MHKKVNKMYVNGIRIGFYRLFRKLITGGWAEDA